MKKFSLIPLLISILLLIADLVLRVWVEDKLGLGESLPIAGGMQLVRLEEVRMIGLDLLSLISTALQVLLLAGLVWIIMNKKSLPSFNTPALIIILCWLLNLADYYLIGQTSNTTLAYLLFSTGSPALTIAQIALYISWIWLLLSIVLNFSSFRRLFSR